jgi:hypothetical protein
VIHIVEDVNYIAERLKEIEKEKELARNVPGSEQGVELPVTPPSRPEPGHYNTNMYP